MKSAREILEELTGNFQGLGCEENDLKERIFIDQALLALREVVVPEEQSVEFQLATQGWDSHTIWLKHYMDGFNACRSELLHRLNGEDR